MAVPYTFGNATTSIPLSNLDTNFATAITLGNTAVYLGNTTTSFGNVTLTNLTISSVASTFPNSFLANSSVTINGSSVSLGGSVTITATSTGNLTIGTGLSGTSYNGSANVTIAIDSTVATLTGSQTLTNKTISGANNTLSNIGNGSLSNSSVTIGNTSVSLGGTATSLGNVTLTNVTISNVASTFPNSFLANSTSTLGNATITLGGTTTNVGNLTLANVTITSVGTTFPNSYLANSSVTLGNASVTLGGTTTSVGNLTLTNATISSVSTPITVAQGGTGLTTITANNVMLGNGTGNVQIVAPGTSGNVLTSTGTTWSSTAPTAQVYPGAGIANSTGTAWGTSYTTNGSGTVVALITSPTFVTPTIGVASATSVNKVAITAPATSATLTLANGSTLATSGAFSQTLTATATTAVTLPTSGTIMSSVTALSGAVTGTPSSTTYLRGDATWATVSGGGTPGGSNTQIQYNSSGSFAGSANLSFDGVSLLSGATTPAYFAGVSNLLQFSINRNPNTGAIFNSAQSCAFMNVDGASGGSSFQFATATAANTQPTEVMRLNSSGNLGIGTSSPASILNVSQATPIVTITKTTPATFSGLNFIYSSATSSILVNDGSGEMQYAAGTGSSGYFQTWKNNGTEGMRLDSSGNLLVGTTSTFNSAYTMSLAVRSSTGGLIIQPGSNGYTAITFNNASGGTAGSISCTSSTTTYSPTSDARLKTNVTPITNGLERISKLKPVDYDWIADGVSDNGFIAQDLLELPEFAHRVTKVGKNKNGEEMYGVDYMKFVAVLTSAIQEQQALITQLTTRLTALENK